MKQLDDGGYVPDFAYRYLTEDVPHGLVAMKGIAELMGVPTPHFDKIIVWAQGKMVRVGWYGCVADEACARGRARSMWSTAS